MPWGRALAPLDVRPNWNRDTPPRGGDGPCSGTPGVVFMTIAALSRYRDLGPRDSATVAHDRRDGPPPIRAVPSGRKRLPLPRRSPRRANTINHFGRQRQHLHRRSASRGLRARSRTTPSGPATTQVRLALQPGTELHLDHGPGRWQLPVRQADCRQGCLAAGEHQRRGQHPQRIRQPGGCPDRQGPHEHAGKHPDDARPLPHAFGMS